MCAHYPVGTTKWERQNSASTHAIPSSVLDAKGGTPTGAQNAKGKTSRADHRRVDRRAGWQRATRPSAARAPPMERADEKGAPVAVISM